MSDKWKGKLAAKEIVWYVDWLNSRAYVFNKADQSKVNYSNVLSIGFYLNLRAMFKWLEN